VCVNAMVCVCVRERERVCERDGLWDATTFCATVNVCVWERERGCV